jgi:hypothetical protein
MCVKRNVRRDKTYSLKLASNGMIDFYGLKPGCRFNMQTWMNSICFFTFFLIVNIFY